jgi:hypothetical protein
MYTKHVANMDQQCMEHMVVLGQLYVWPHPVTFTPSNHEYFGCGHCHKLQRIVVIYDEPTVCPCWGFHPVTHRKHTHGTMILRMTLLPSETTKLLSSHGAQDITTVMGY